MHMVCYITSASVKLTSINHWRRLHVSDVACKIMWLRSRTIPVLRCVTSLLGPLVIVYIMWETVSGEPLRHGRCVCTSTRGLRICQRECHDDMHARKCHAIPLQSGALLTQPPWKWSVCLSLVRREQIWRLYALGSQSAVCLLAASVRSLKVNSVGDPKSICGVLRLKSRSVASLCALPLLRNFLGLSG